MEPHEPPASTRAGRPRWLGLAAVVALAAAVVAVLATGGGDDGPPEAWDERVAELAEFVERERGLDFDHPVETRFLAAADFRKEVTDDEELSAEDEEELAHFEGLFRALGLAEGDLDLRGAANQLSGEGVIGLYLPEEDRILVRGERITAGMRPTIVHELTHALQAQHFDLDLERDTSGEEIAFRALVEADAVRIETAYIESLAEDEREAVGEEQQAQADALDLEGVPPILTELFSLPYVFGPPFLDAVEADGGERAIDDAFRDPPTTEEHLIDPVSFLDDDEPTEVPAPKLRSGERRVDEPDDFGMLSLLLVLGERVPFPQAWAAVDGWAGDASVTYRSGGKDCIRIRTELDTEDDAGELRRAVEAWIGDRSTARASSSGTAVVLSSCDPGTDAATATPDRPRTFELVQLRVELLASLEANGLPHGTGVCVADAVLRDNDPQALLDLNAVQDPQDPRIVGLQRQVVATVERCQGGG